MARALGVPRQSVGYYLKSGVNGAQAAAIIGLVARVMHRERREACVRQLSAEARHDELAALLARHEPL